MKFSALIIKVIAIIFLFSIISCRLWNASGFPSDGISPTSTINQENSQIIDVIDSQPQVTFTETNPQLPSTNVPNSLNAATIPATITADSTLHTPTAEFTPTPCSDEVCVYPNHFFLKRPILSPGNDAVDGTYRFGSTQSGKREPHHGVEMLNGFGTPVYAAADGVVVVAGDDVNPISPQGV